MDILRLQSLTKRYGPVVALDDVTIGFAAGSFTAIMGASGSGKSTLLQCAAGLDRVDAGSVTIADVTLGELGETARTRFRRDRIGFVFQAFNLLPSLTAAQNVGLPLMLAGSRPPRATLVAALAAVGLAERADHRPDELSGGQRQRVAIARALVAGPAVLFADEPTGALDAATSREILRLFRWLADERGQTVVMVTHDPVAAADADAVVFLRDGRLTGRLDRPTVQTVADHVVASC